VAVLSASSGTPSLFEVKGEAVDRPWMLAFNGSGATHLVILRKRQLGIFVRPNGSTTRKGSRRSPGLSPEKPA
jgi:hypothetical protein